MDILNGILSWGGCLLLLLGLKLIGDQKKVGFYVAMVAEVMWIVWGILTHSWALVGISTAIMGMYVRAIVQWNQKEKQTNDVKPLSPDSSSDDLP
jgi:hypothetical protein